MLSSAKPLPLSFTAAVNFLQELSTRKLVFKVSKLFVWPKMVQGIDFTQPMSLSTLEYFHKGLTLK